MPLALGADPTRLSTDFRTSGSTRAAARACLASGTTCAGAAPAGQTEARQRLHRTATAAFLSTALALHPVQIAHLIGRRPGGIIVPLHQQHAQSGHDQQQHDRADQHAANDHGGKRTLHLAANPM